MKKKIGIIIISSILILIIMIGLIYLYKDYQVKHAIKIVNLSRNKVEVFEKVYLKDLIKEINGTLEKNTKVDTNTIGEKEISFYYTTDKKIKVPYTIKINVVDETPPIISMSKEKTVPVGTLKEDFKNSLFCGDNYDDTPKCTIEGDYDLNKVGSYSLIYRGVDSSNNESKYSFTLNVISPSKNKNNNQAKEEPLVTRIDDVIKEYKNKSTKIGIDVSKWQGDIDFKKVKQSGIEFVYIRVGRGNGIGKEYILDDKFIQNIKGFNEVGIPVGVYFYSYASNKSDARKEANWVLKQIKKYKVDLEIAFDWENWSFYKEFHLSFYHLTEMAKEFIKTVEKEGYKGMLYSSKSYLENIWFPNNETTWLAHYTQKTNYEGKYKVWQICNNGKVSGIEDNLVDIDIRYEK